MKTGILTSALLLGGCGQALAGGWTDWNNRGSSKVDPTSTVKVPTVRPTTTTTVSSSVVNGTHSTKGSSSSQVTSSASAAETKGTPWYNWGNNGNNNNDDRGHRWGWPPVSYAGPPLSGLADIPHSLSTVVFPSGRPTASFPKCSGLSLGKNGLAQDLTNGNSHLGALDAPRYPKFIGDDTFSRSSWIPGQSASTASGLKPTSSSIEPSTGSASATGAAGKTTKGASDSSTSVSKTASTSGGLSTRPTGVWPPAGGFPWGNRTANGTNPYKNAPRTGVIRSYNFVVERAVLAPDGVARNVLVINGQYPGPTIEANWGDTVRVTVTNKITGPDEGTAFHWHGLLQKGTQYEDGVPGITQCPLAPGQTFTYEFNADLYGTSWYHAHYSAQYAGGLYGAMIIYGPPNAFYDEDLGPVMLTDYYHDDYFTIVERVMGNDLSQIAPLSDNNLINGKNDFNCSSVASNVTCTPNAGLAKFHFDTGKSYRLRLINSGSEGIQRFSIDGHKLTVVAQDFVPIVPFDTNVVSLGIGQRTDVIVHANLTGDTSVWMRSEISTTCSLAKQPKAQAIVYYNNADTTAEPTSTGWPIDDSACGNEPLSKTVPFASITPPTVDTTVDVALSFTVNSTGNFLWTMDGSAFRVNYNKPLLMIADGQTFGDSSSNSSSKYEREWNVYDFGSNKSYAIVINNETPVAHPMHIHGHNMFVLNEGVGKWDGTVVNPSNPARRDVQIVQPGGYIAIQVDADNPGVWPFHCHIAWHVSGGLYINLLERPNDIPSSMSIPAAVNDLCTTWDQFSKTGYVNQIDSGLRRRQHLRDHLRHRIADAARWGT